MVNVVCVLKSGGVYGPEYVEKLYTGVCEHLMDCEFHVLSDVPGVATIPLKHNWSGWWSKLELFRPKLFDGPVLYFDLDTVIQDDLHDIAASIHGFTMLSDFTRPKEVASGVMAWDGDYSYLYQTFASHPQKWQKMYPQRGDGLFIADHLRETPYRWQELVPRQIVSYKVHRRKGQGQDASVVCFHGNPRPHEVNWHV